MEHGPGFEIVGEIGSVETIAANRGIRERARLAKRWGQGRWRKRKGVATARFADSSTARAEVHWYEASGIGRREIKIKRLLGGD